MVVLMTNNFRWKGTHLFFLALEKFGPNKTIVQKFYYKSEWNIDVAKCQLDVI